MAGANTGLRLRNGSGVGHKVSAPEGPSGQALTQGTSLEGSWGTLWAQSCATLPSPSSEEEEDSGLGQAATLSCPVLSSANQKGFDVCLKMKPRYANVFMMLAMFLQSSMPLWGRPMCCRLRPLFMSSSPFLGQQPMAKL